MRIAEPGSDVPSPARAGTAAAAAASAKGTTEAPGFVGPLAQALAELSAGSESRHFVEAAAPMGPPVPRPALGSLSAVPPAADPAPPSRSGAAPKRDASSVPGAEPRLAAEDAPTPAADEDGRGEPPQPAADAAPEVPAGPAAPPTVLVAAASLTSCLAALGHAGGAAAPQPTSPALAHAPPAPSAALPVAALPEGATVHIIADGAAAHAARVELQHPELGAIRLDLRLDQGNLEVRALTASAATAMTLRASEATLRESIAIAGVVLRAMRVDHADDEAGETQKARRGHRSSRRRPLDTEA